MILLILLAFALRLYRLEAQSLWYDEGVTVNVAQRNLAELTTWTANDIQPPLYYYLIAGWGRLAGWSEWSLRFPSAFFGLLLVPLLSALARRLSANRTAALLAGLFTALHPMLLYYSQEARMYTLLTALGALAGYCVVRGAWCVKEYRWIVFYVLSATAAVYTHYFAFFLLFALSIAFLIHRIRNTQYATRNTGSNFLLANLIILLLYLPWLGILFTRLRADASYWQGEFKLGEAIRNIAISFTSGQTLPERQATWLLLPFVLITLIALTNSIQHDKGSLVIPHSTFRIPHFTLLWLLLPTAAVLLLASFAPKFNTRYVMLALPGLILLWSDGLAKLVGSRYWGIGIEEKSIRSIPKSPYLLAVASIAFMLMTFMHAHANWFFNPVFRKDQWRELAAFLRREREPQEAILLVSGHAWPVWAYYAPDLPPVRLPGIDVLDVNAILAFANTAIPLRTTFAEKSGISGAWLIGWQEEVVDPTGIVPVQLELGGREKGVSARFWGLDLRRFSQIRAHRIVDAAPITHRMDVRFGNYLLLHGYHLVENGDLLLFWQRLAEADNSELDLQMAAQTLTTSSTPLLRLPDQRPAGYAYPVVRWSPDEIVMGRIPANGWLGPVPTPGTYTLRLSIYMVADRATQTLTTADGRTEVDLPITVDEFD